MNIKRNYISAISGKTVTWILFVLLLFSFTTLSSCRDDRMDSEPTPPDPNELTSDVLFEINLPESATPSTYALTPVNEDEIKTVEILLFKIEGAIKTYTGKPYYCDSIINGAISKEKYFIVSLPKGGPYDIVVLTNSRDRVKKVLVEATPPDTEKDALLKLLTFNHDTKWVSDATSTKYIPIPMWGEIKNEKITWNLRFKTRLMRMLAKIDVEISTDATTSFTLKEIYLANPNTDGQIVPTHFYPNGKISAPTLSGSVPNATPIIYTPAEASGPSTVFKNVIYTFEAKKADATESATWSKSTCLILKGIYKDDGGEYFYRIDFGNSASGKPVYLDILRNMQYSLKITRISAPGHTSYEAALASPSANIESETVVWDHSELPIIVFDNNHTLGFSSDDITMSFQAGTTNQMKIRTDNPGGWKVDKIVADDGMSPVSWLTVTSKGIANTTADVAFTIMENGTGSSRVCYIHFSAGDLKHIVKVTQMKAFMMEQVIWKDYLGVDFNTITIKDELGGVFTSKVNPSGFLVDVNGTTLKPMRFGALIAEVKVTYKNYVLTVPPTNYFHNYDTQVLTILDRSLIGLPIHLDKIRDSLAGSYIQVDDIDLAGYMNMNGERDNWMPIGTAAAPFTGNYKGTFIGGNHYSTIDNLIINRTSRDYVGLFGNCSQESFLNLIYIKSGSIKGRSYVGAIGGQIGKIQSASSYASVEGATYVGGIAGSITNLASGLFFYFNATNSIKATGDFIGGLCGINTGEINGSSVRAPQNSTNKTILGYRSSVGGICGTNAGKIINCTSMFLEIKGVSKIGGIAGDNSGTIDGLISGTKVDSTKNQNSSVIGTTQDIGGIAGSNSGTINFSKNMGDITGSGAASTNIGGIVGQNTAGAKITHASNNGTIVGFKNLGGIVGAAIENSLISNCTNNAKGVVKGTEHVGGIAGLSNESTIQKCINDYDKDNNIDKIIGAGEKIGGICGLALKSIITKSRNRAVVIGDGDYIGGICGQLYVGSEIKFCENDGHIKGNLANSKYVGGINGSSVGSQILNCVNNATYEGSNHLGGISGMNDGSLATVTACYNIGGRPSAATESGAIIGAVYNGAFPVDACYYGEAATAGNAHGAIRFGASPAWPNTGSNHWKTPFPWFDLGSNATTYPILNWDLLMSSD